MRRFSIIGNNTQLTFKHLLNQESRTLQLAGESLNLSARGGFEGFGAIGLCQKIASQLNKGGQI